MQVHPLRGICFVVSMLVLGGCQAPSLTIEKPLAAPQPGEPASYYSVSVGSTAGVEKAAEVCKSLVEHVRYELVRHGLADSADHHANRSIRLKVVEFSEVSPFSRASIGMLAGTENFVVEVEVRANDSDSVIGLAWVTRYDFYSAGSRHVNAVVNEVAESIADFIRGKS